jgi:cytochrome b involved in lipid metabolism
MDSFNILLGPVLSNRCIQGRPVSTTRMLRVAVQVYDVTQFAPNHPGGKAILAYGGRDASDVFAAFHASGTHKILRQFYIGEVEVRMTVREETNALRSVVCKFSIASLPGISTLYLPFVTGGG